MLSRWPAAESAAGSSDSMRKAFRFASLVSRASTVNKIDAAQHLKKKNNNSNNPKKEKGWKEGEDGRKGRMEGREGWKDGRKGGREGKERGGRKEGRLKRSI